MRCFLWMSRLSIADNHICDMKSKGGSWMIRIEHLFMQLSSSDLSEIVTAGLLLFPKGQVHTD